MAGARSLGSSIGPSAYQPMDWASLARSMLGLSMDAGILAQADIAVLLAGHSLNFHKLGVIGAVIVHDR